MKKITYIPIIIVFGLLSCVPLKQFQDVKSEKASCASEKDSLSKALTNATLSLTETNSANRTLQSKIRNLESDTASLGKTKRDIVEQNEKLEQLNNQLLNKQTSLIQDNAKEAKQMLKELQVTREDLQRREDSLETLSVKLRKERAVIDQMKNELGFKEEEIAAKNEKLAEMESILRKKDSLTFALKNKISEALLGFEGYGLTIEQRDGKIYVSVEEELLFQVGKAEVAPKGQEALKKLAKVLEKNTDINILVEGHTDNTGTEELNWKLSTKRAHAITEILLGNSTIAGKRITVAGRGQFVPLDPSNTKEARAKNRRSEIILTPDLSELFNLINE